MAEELRIPKVATREGMYKILIPQFRELLGDESDMIAKMANVAAVLKEAFGFFWVGFYRVTGEELVLGPFQGSLACTRIAYGRGVCGTAWKEAKTLIVPDVHQFPGHIACSSISRSEIVVPIKKVGTVFAVLDIDSERLNYFDNSDALYLEKICDLLK